MAPLAELPLFVRAGAIIPNGPEMNYDAVCVTVCVRIPDTGRPAAVAVKLLP